MPNYEQQYLGLIIQEYETMVMKNHDSKSFKLMMYKSVDDLKSITSVTKKTTDSFPGSKYNFDEKPSGAKDRTKKKSSAKALKKIGLESVKDSTLEDYLEKCFGCDARLSFDFQFLPPDAMLGSFLNMLKEIEYIIGQITLSFDSKKRVEQLCSVAAMFNGIPCPQDLLTIILSLKILLGRYSDIGISLKIDWLTLLGPIIQGLTQLLGSLVSMAFDAVIGPIDCTGALMMSGIDVLRLQDPDTYSTGKSKKSAKSSSSKTEDNILKTNYGGGASIEQEGSATSFSAGASSSLIVSTDKLPTDKLTDLMSNNPNGNNFFDLSMPEQLLLAVGEARNFLNDFKKKIMATVDNLNGLVKSGKLFELKNLSIAIFIADLISFLIQLLNTDFKSLCTDPKKSPLLENFILDLTGAEKVRITSAGDETEAAIYGIDGIVSTVKLNSCSLSANAVDLNEIQNILAEIERLTNGK